MLGVATRPPTDGEARQPPVHGKDAKSIQAQRKQREVAGENDKVGSFSNINLGESYRQFVRAYRKSYWHRLFKSRADRGLLKTIRLVIEERLPDFRYGIKVAGLVELDSLHLDSENKVNGYRYEAVNTSAFKAAFAKLQIPYGEFSFIDLGCGKGFALMLASQYGFKKLIGVEFSPELVVVCRENLARYFASSRQVHRPPYDILQLDVSNFRLPPGALVIFLCNPFDEVTLKLTLRNFLGLRGDKHENLYVVYVNALHKEVLLDLGFHLLYFLPTDPLKVYKNGIAVFRL